MGLFFKDKPKVVPAKVVSIDKNNEFKQPIIDKPLSGNYSGHFSKLMEELNQQGMDFFEFNKVLKLNENLPIDEKQKYLTSFTAFQAQGISSDTLIESAKFYLGKFEEEKASFEGFLVKSRQVKVEDVKKQMSTLAEENETLARRIAENNSKRQELALQSNKAEEELGSKERGFRNEYTQAYNTLQEMISKIKLYLNATT